MPFLPNGGGLLVSVPPNPDRSYGILSSIEPIHLDDPHWQGGIEFESDCSVEASSTLLPCPEPVSGKVPDDDGLMFCTADPFTVMGSYKCTPVGRPVSEAKTIATNRLRKNKERSVEQIFWTGITQAGSINPSLQGGNDSCGIEPVDLTPLASGAVSPVAAIAALESAVAACVPGGVGVIHLTFGFLPYLAANHLLYERDNKLYTPSGQLIIAGAGYPGSGPGNLPTAPGETWVFGSGQTSVFFSDVFYTSKPNEGVDRNINNVTLWAEETFSVIFECCLFAIRVSLC